MNNQIYQKEIVEIDLKELIWDIVSQWKAVVLASLLMALLFCGAKYVKDNSNYRAVLEQQKETEAQKNLYNNLSKEEQIANIIKTLSVEDAEDVWLVVQEKEWLEKQKEYLTDSLLMGVDPTDQHVLSLVYLLNCENIDNLPVLLQSYESILDSEETAETVKAVINSNADSRYVEELLQYEGSLTSSDKNGAKAASFTVKIVIPDDMDVEEVADALTNALKEQGQRLKAECPHSIFLVHYNTIRTYNSNVIREHKSLIDSINGIKASIKSAESNMSVKQKEAVEAISAIITDTDIFAEQEIQPESETLVSPGISMKYAFLGFIMGIFLYVFCYVVIVILRGAVSDSSGVERYTKGRLLGEVYYTVKRTGLSKLLHSDFVDKLRYKGLIDFNTQVNKTEESVEAVCMHTKANEVSFIGLIDTDSIEHVKDAMLSIIGSIGDKGIKSSVLDAVGEFGENNFLDINNAVLVVGDNTKISNLGKVAALCRDYDINLLGSIYFSEM